MFSTGTQAKHWTFESERELLSKREKANRSYISRYEEDTHGSSMPSFLVPSEEQLLCKYFEFTLHEFCKKFKPPLPKSVYSCSFHYYKRFYLNNSVMDYHPKHIIVTCVFLACKTEEFNVSITQFVANVKGDRAKAKEIILSHELMLMQHLEYHLIVHHPYRPIEGFLIDMKTRCPKIQDPERFRLHIEAFLDQIYFTDAVLLFAPSQVALAALAYAGMKFKENLVETYILEVVFAESPKENCQHIKEAIKRMLSMVKSIEAPPKDQVKAIEKKLEKCRNEENNPSSSAYKRKLETMQEDEEIEQTRKYMRLAEEQEKADREVLGASSKK